MDYIKVYNKFYNKNTLFIFEFAKVFKLNYAIIRYGDNLSRICM